MIEKSRKTIAYMIALLGIGLSATETNQSQSIPTYFVASELVKTFSSDPNKGIQEVEQMINDKKNFYNFYSNQEILNVKTLVLFILAFKKELLAKENLDLFFDLELINTTPDNQNLNTLKDLYNSLKEFKSIEDVVVCCQKQIWVFIEHLCQLYEKQAIPLDRIEDINSFFAILVKNGIPLINKGIEGFHINRSKEGIIIDVLKRIAKAILSNQEYNRVNQNRKALNGLNTVSSRGEEVAKLVSRYLFLNTAIDTITEKLAGEERGLWEEALRKAKEELEK